ncbi:MAG: ABC transporter ATP-binding protein [Dongiaceae bacterium]
MTTAAAILAASPAVELIGIDKRFGPVHANRDVTVAIARGSIHGIIGENGAGKSTLMSILYGYYRADAGEIRVNGRQRPIAGTRDAIAAGIGMVHQHFMLVDDFSVVENVMLGVEGAALLGPAMARARAALLKLSQDYGLAIDPEAIIHDLPVGLQQRVEILKALYRGAQILILDEPTAVLTPQEADQLFQMLGRLRDQGKTVILITHKLREIMAVTDRVTVMRGGAVVATVDTATTSREQLAEMMVGRKVLLQVDKPAAEFGNVTLDVRGLTVVDAGGIARVDEVSFTVRAGEIVGVAGVSGNGQSELLEALAGMRPFRGGITIAGAAVASDGGATLARLLRRRGVGHVPEDRQREGLVGAFDACESAILGHQGDPAYNGPILMNRARIVERCDAEMAAFDVRPPNPLLRTAAFSGGNQQKIVLAREMERDPGLLLVGQPTRGVDIGAIEFIHRRLLEMRAAGKAILLVSVELDEILALADRILVMFDGRIVGEMPRAEATEARLGLLMAGVTESSPRYSMACP